MRDALAFLTVLPVGARDRAPGRRAALLFPVVGAVVGVAWGATGWAGTRVWGAFAGAVLVGAADLLLTGALHLDALADVSDGVASRRRGAEAIVVMRDPAIGAIGAAALVLALAMRIAFVAVLLAPGRWWYLVAAPVAGRVAMVWLMARADTVPEGSLASGLCEVCSVPLALSASLIAVAVAYPAAGVRGVGSVVLGALVAEGLRPLFRRRFTVVTGDVCGATGLLAEIAALAVLSARFV